MNIALIVIASVVGYVAMMFVAGAVARVLRRHDFVIPRVLPTSDIFGNHEARTAIRVLSVLWPVGALVLFTLLLVKFLVFLSACVAGSAADVKVDGPSAVRRGYDRGAFGKNDRRGS